MIMVYIGLLIILVVMWYPGFSMSRNVIKAVNQVEPTVGQTVLACIPGFQLANCTGVVGSRGAMPCVIVHCLCVVAVLQRYVFFFFFEDAVMLSLVSLIVLWIAFLVTWIYDGVVIASVALVCGCGLVSKILGFIFPPAACYIIGRNCIANVAAALEEIDREHAIG